MIINNTTCTCTYHFNIVERLKVNLKKEVNIILPGLDTNGVIWSPINNNNNNNNNNNKNNNVFLTLCF